MEQMIIKATLQEAFNFFSGYKGREWKKRKVSYGEAPYQYEIKFQWFARIYIDMKKAIGERMKYLKDFKAFENASNKDVLKAANKWVQRDISVFKKMFFRNGDISACPDYVYFLD